MKALVSHDTALTYWRCHFPLDSEIGQPVNLNIGESFAYRMDDVLGCYPELYVEPESPVHVLVPDESKRRYSKRTVCHSWTSDIPDGAFHGWGSYCVSSPEFLFLQMSPELTVAQLVAFGCELCGTYVLLPKDAIRLDSFDEYPERIASLTNIEKLKAFLGAAGRARGVSKARRALKYVAEGSRSPMETRTYMQLCLPPLLGGYGLPKAQLNWEIELDEEARRIAGSRFCWGDICFPDKKLDVEYYGDVHSGVAKMKRDAGRTLGIEHMGWRVMVLTSAQVFDIDKFEVVAKEVAAHLGHRLRSRVLDNYAARMTLHEELDAWMSRV